ncbi:MAG: helix-turn-helix domain-containing protein [Prolixibacteraceae bacterium]|nr:helix-turn-helix domain-containing protein [Prolixibacteraceae bacterium]MBN2774305.1 helix-turn-helix domain-containing protein [Prolixibacteraceae bacterium]
MYLKPKFRFSTVADFTMADSQFRKNDFLNKLIELIGENISNEQFGVSELADRIGMSRSNLLRKIKKLTDLSASQFIRQIRLEYAMELLKEENYNVSEVSYKVGFGSTSYFIKCFHDFYGYPPGEVGKKEVNENFIHASGDSTQTHRLAAIMFTDIEGYTALMQQDEKSAVELRNRHREIINSITQKFNGKILQYYGDGTLSTFNSAIDAVRCGIELQLAFREKPLIPVRIGIHSGDIIFNEDGIVGDGVNVASRIEALAIAGSVFISEKIYDEIKNQSGIYTVPLGEFELKNVGKPIEVFALANAGLLVPKREQLAGKIKRESFESGKSKASEKKFGLKWILIFFSVVFIFVLAIVLFAVIKPVSFVQWELDKSIAVLPFKNDSADSTNVYFINGVMESVLTDLQKIEGLRVISRTSVEKYRNTDKTMREIAKELDASYLVEGSGQKLGDQVFLNIRLIEGPSDKRLWAEQYNRNTEDIFKIQMEVAKSIADEIEVLITPEEEQRIAKAPTKNMDAYDVFLKGLDILSNSQISDKSPAIPYFRNAISLDNEFARAYAAIAITYYYLDEDKPIKEYSDSINFYADKALFYDSQLPQSLIAKALFYVNNREYDLAVNYFERALEYNPNYDLVFAFLVDLYVNHIPNTEKYLEYALKGIRLDKASYDSLTISVMYLHISNSMVQSGFVNEAEKFIERSLDYDPANLYSEYVKAYILYAKNRDLQQLKDRLLITYKKDTTRMDVLQEVAKICYYMKDFEEAYSYYKRLITVRETYNLNLFRSEDLKIGYVCAKVGLQQEAEKYYNLFLEYSENDQSIYKHLNFAMYYSAKGDNEKALEHLELFSERENYHYWTILFLKLEPAMGNIVGTPEFNRIFDKIEKKFQDYHNKLKNTLETKGLL